MTSLEMIRKEMEENENLSVKRFVGRKGGLDNLTEKQAEDICNRFHIRMASPEQSAFENYMSLYDQYEGIAATRAKLWEASNVWEAAAIDDKIESNLYKIYTNQMAEIKEEMGAYQELAQKYAKFVRVELPICD